MIADSASPGLVDPYLIGFPLTKVKGNLGANLKLLISI
jgi:hypothetical protein